MTKPTARLPRLTPVDRDTIQERVYQQLREALMTGQLSPGDPVKLQTLAEAFGTSAMPVREALKQLVAEQALVARPNRSAIVPLLTAERLDEVRCIRVALEGMLAERAAARITAPTVQRLRMLHDDMCGAVHAGEIKRYLAKNQEFHFIIYTAADLPNALRLVQNLWLQVGPVMNFLLGGENKDKKTMLRANVTDIFEDNHFRVVEALDRKDGLAAREAIANDVNVAADYLLSLKHFKSVPS
ncbi:MAG: GntR family transcriptional regulator [Paracoccaceae bacterium]|nr:GntR family transcriptional regulator [Paracoccaceae bacterium]MDE2913859.1 GntR family transcriptional regulator [Paracoccaceae bacterium]